MHVWGGGYMTGDVAGLIAIIFSTLVVYVDDILYVIFWAKLRVERFEGLEFKGIK